MASAIFCDMINKEYDADMPRALIPSLLANYDLPDESHVRTTIGQRIRELRQKNRMSQIELSQNLGKQSATFIALIEQGKRGIDSADLARLASHMKVSLSYFYP